MRPDPEVIARDIAVYQIQEANKPFINGWLYGIGLRWDVSVDFADKVLDELVKLVDEIGEY